MLVILWCELISELKWILCVDFSFETFYIKWLFRRYYSSTRKLWNNKTNSLEVFYLDSFIYIWWREMIYSCKKGKLKLSTKHVHCSQNNTHYAIKLNIIWNDQIFYFLHQNCHLQAGPHVYGGIKMTLNHNRLNSLSQFWYELMDMRCDTTILL